MSKKNALVVGVTGISGSNVADHLLANGFTVFGLARRPPQDRKGVTPVAADLMDPASIAKAVAGLDISHVYFCTWARQDTEDENCRVNGAMLRNLLDAVTQTSKPDHVALVTGLKHYLGPFESYGKVKPDTPFREDQARLPYQNFYYVQEDILYEAAAQHGFAWSVHRPHTLIGWALGNAMNMGVTLAVYAAICKETGRKLLFPGTPQQHEAVTDVTDARILARQLVWASTTPSAFNQAFNIVNGDVFRWRRLWATIGAHLGVEVETYPGHPTPLEQQMAGMDATWDAIVTKYGLQSYKLSTLASWWHSDADLGRELETFTDMTKSREFGFLDLQVTERSFTDLFDRLRAEKIIPPASAG
ncbi:SDR family oxidoreductase [Lichenihabitans sp. Uapishka_5]|uniref:SDR family oxidoreductase n=1 Tax=Lichenihabitans sp. Uapishka_5 TaxID=3037302 RepID=UPI0029E80E9E|nr:SDR family oxidoreductase [Lichenihabitans sp. Uapishka_5]MDX7951742.1 SDR family oxidoreductase [Lichenihabitans sp. Uapishka_5]